MSPLAVGRETLVETGVPPYPYWESMRTPWPAAALVIRSGAKLPGDRGRIFESPQRHSIRFCKVFRRDGGLADNLRHDLALEEPSFQLPAEVRGIFVDVSTFMLLWKQAGCQFQFSSLSL